jgi:hypothetical protein
MSKKSMAARRQMREATAEGRTGGNRQQSRSRPRGRNYRRNESGRPWGMISAVLGIVAVFVIVVVVLELTLQGSLKQDTQVLPAPASLINSVTSTPLKTLEAVKAGSITHPPVNVPASYKAVALSSQGLPEIAYVGAEYCPYCALQRWSLVIGLSHFGKWSNLHLIHSSVYEAASSLATFTFAHGAKFTSPYFVFVGREHQNNISLHHDGAPYGGFQSLSKTLTAAFTGIAGGSYPFVDYGGKMAQVGSGAAPTNVAALHGLTWDQIAQKLRNPKSVVAQEVLGGANYVTAATCLLTGQKPGAVCTSSMIRTLEGQLEGSA